MTLHDFFMRACSPMPLFDDRYERQILTWSLWMRRHGQNADMNGAASGALCERERLVREAEGECDCPEAHEPHCRFVL